MDALQIERYATLWLANELPTRMIYAGRRWKVSDAPTRLREAVWGLPLEGGGSMFGWRFQATDPSGASYVFDVYKADEHRWHVHHCYD